MKLFSLCLIIFSVVIIVVGIIKVHELPGEIARRRGHPQAEAIRVCSLLGLLVFPFWMFALLWAHTLPVFAPIPVAGQQDANDQTEPSATDEGQA